MKANGKKSEWKSWLPITPSTDPDVRDYRIRLLPQVMTPHRRRGYDDHMDTIMLSNGRIVKPNIQPMPDHTGSE